MHALILVSTAGGYLCASMWRSRCFHYLAFVGHHLMRDAHLPPVYTPKTWKQTYNIAAAIERVVSLLIHPLRLVEMSQSKRVRTPDYFGADRPPFVSPSDTLCVFHSIHLATPALGKPPTVDLVS
jgi:hypothetical protein